MLYGKMLKMYNLKIINDKMKRVFLWMMLGAAMVIASCQSEPVKVSVVATSDLETALLAHDYKYSMDARGGAALVATYLKERKSEIGEQNVVYVDNGDILSGWVINNYMKEVETNDTTLAAAAMNLLDCAVYGIGEGDIAQGRELLNKHTKSTKGSAVCANLVDATSGKLIYKPYAVVERAGMKIAFLGLITEWADKYMCEESFAGLKVTDAEEAAKRWIQEIKKNENPDVVIGLFHMGAASVSKRTGSREDMAVTIARNVAGFDAIVCGHNGLHRSKTVESISGEKVILASPGRRGIYLLDIDITAERDGEGFKNKKVDVAIKSMLTRKADNDYIVAMRPRVAELRKFTNTPVGNVKNMALSIDALFGSSAYIDFMHKVQLNYTGADLSIAHPYVIDEGLFEGPVSPSQIRNICPFDGKLYTVKMTGEEIEKMLSHSVSQFYKLMKKKEDDLLKYDAEKKRMKENCKSLESVGGLRYNVHVNKKTNDGKLQIIGLSNGKKLEPKKEYKVAVSEEYVMNTNLAMSLGAGIKQHDMVNRVVAVSKKDLTELTMDYIKEKGTVELKSTGDWKLLPAAWMKEVQEREMKKLMGAMMAPEIDPNAVQLPVSK